MTCETKKKIMHPQNYLNIVICDRYDLVDLTRQVLSKLANQVYRDAMIAFRRKDARALNLHGQKFLQIIKDIDVLLASDDNFLLGTWLESAKRLAVDPNDMKLVRTNSSLASENNSIVII
jgi:alpha-N-acetylglucosaminidase